MPQGFQSGPPIVYYENPPAGPSSQVQRQMYQPVYVNNGRSHTAQLGALPPPFPVEGYFPNAHPVMRPVQSFMPSLAGFRISPHPSEQFHMAHGNQSPMTGPSYGYHHQHVVTPIPASDFRFDVPELYSKKDGWTGEWSDDLVKYRGGQEVICGNFEVKHRRRTTPEQLKILEHWFDVNPKPDSALREWLAQGLGVTKRDVQVWFQNRRAKIKGQMVKDKANKVDEEQLQ